MLQSDNLAELLAALAEVQSELPTMPKSSQAYGYKYTDLDTITQTIKPILGKHGIGYMQSVGGATENALTLTTRIFNKKGEYIEDTAALPTIASTKNNAAQTLGMSITYMRRYALCAMLGITSDEDLDANLNGTTQTKEINKPTPQKLVASPKQHAKFDFEPKGGETTPASQLPQQNKYVFTPAEKKEMRDMTGSSYFTAEETAAYTNRLRNMTVTAKDLLWEVRHEYQARITEARQNQNQQTTAELADQAAQTQDQTPAQQQAPSQPPAEYDIF